MTDREISEILLIRSVEESNPDYFTPDVLLESLRKGGEAKSDSDLILRRAHYLYEGLPDTLKDIPGSISLARKWTVLSCMAVFLIGILINYLGPGDKIHILYNPVVLLVFWNLAVFTLFFIRHFFLTKGETAAAPLEKAAGRSVLSEERPHRAGSPLKGYTSITSQWLLRKVWFSLHREFIKKKQDVKQITSPLKVTYTFMEHWWDIHHRVYSARLIRLIHVLAVCLVLGALAGIYMRGLFFEYNIVWQSTFIHNSEKIALILNVLFGLPSQLVNGAFIDESAVRLLLTPGGSPAASWIHLLAVSAVMFVIPERLFLVLLESRRVTSEESKRAIDLVDPYYERYVLLAQEMQESRLRDEISLVVQRAITGLAASVAAYSRDNFFDTRIVPLFITFRNNGGRIRDLEDEIERESETFRESLNSFLEEAQEDFRASLSEGVSAIIGEKLTAIELDVGKDVHVRPETYRDALDESVTRNMTSSISLAVTAAVAATAGTISGGFGKVLGIAIVSAILHTSGPVGFLIGALAGLLLGGGAAVLAKDKITDVVKNRDFPAFSTQILMRESKLHITIEEGRAEVYRVIRTEIEGKLVPQAEEITNQILSRIAVPSRELNN